MEMEMDSETLVGAHGKPCISCRKRKIKCDRSRPCSNCRRSKQLCAYESPDTRNRVDGLSPAMASSDADLRERLAVLEKMMAAMMSTSTSTSSDAGEAPQAPAQRQRQRPGVSPLVRVTSHSSYEENISSSFAAATENSTSPVGQIWFQEGCSAYHDADFWPGLIPEIEDLRRLFEASSSLNSPSPWPSLLPPAIPPHLILAHPTVEESNKLCKHFFERVHPFTRIIHQTLFTKELDQYRRGTLGLPREFEALLFCIYLLTINTLRPTLVQEIFSAPKPAVLARFQFSAQAALTNINYMKTEAIHGLGALLHYITFLFQQNLYKDAVSLLAIASNLSQTLGIHRDPSHFPYSPWVCNIRRRIYNYISCLDGHAINSYGSESCLPTKADSKPPQNSNDRDWHASRFAKPADAPGDEEGVRDMSFVLVYRAISDCIRELADIGPTEFEKREDVIRKTESFVMGKYLRDVDNSNPSHTVIVAFLEIKLATLRLSIRQRQTEKSRSHAIEGGRYQVFIAAITLLEAHQYHTTAFSTLSWDWLFTSQIPWLALAIVLTEIPHAERQLDKNRGQRMVEYCFGFYDDESQAVRETPMWKLILQLRSNMENPVRVDPSVGVGVGAVRGMVGIGEFGDDLMLDFGEGTGFAEFLEQGDGFTW